MEQDPNIPQKIILPGDPEFHGDKQQVLVKNNEGEYVPVGTEEKPIPELILESTPQTVKEKVVEQHESPQTLLDKLRADSNTLKPGEKEYGEVVEEKPVPPVVTPTVEAIPQAPKPATPEEPKKEKKIYNAAVIDTTQLTEAQARDVADSRMTESKEDRSKNWVSRNLNRIWKHNLAQEYYRQSAIAKAKKEIIESGNLHYAEDGGTIDTHKAAMAAVIERFTSEYSADMLKKEEFESKHPDNEELNGAVKKLIEYYAGTPTMTEANFIEERNRVLSSFNQDEAKKGITQADNLLEIAREVRNSVDSGTKLAELDFEVKVTVGKARESLNTEANMNSFDKGVEWLQNSKVGKFFVNEGVIATAAGLYSAGVFTGQKVLRSNFAKIGSFGATAVLSAALAGAKESARITRERSQDARERAKGNEFDPESKRRAEMAESSYETVSVAESLPFLEQATALFERGVDIGNADEVAIIGKATKHLIEIESRIALGTQRNIDLIRYSHTTAVEIEQNKLNLQRAKLKAFLKKEFSPEDYKTHVSDKIAGYKEELEGGVTKKDEVFSKMKRGKIAKAFIKTALIGGTVGLAVQEAKALFDGAEDGIIEGTIKTFRGHNEELAHTATVGEAVRRNLLDIGPRVPMGHEHEMVIGNTHFRLPEEVQMQQHADGTFEITRDGDIVADHLHLEFTPTGDLTHASKELLLQDDIFTGTTYVNGSSAESAADYLKEHANLTTKVHRQLFYDNDTPHPFDKNELKTEWVGKKIPLLDHTGKVLGERGSGIDEHGNYVFNVSGMKADGSYHNGVSVNAEDAIKRHGLKMAFSLSKDTQHTPILVDVDEHGNAIIEKNSELAKLMFKEEDGHAVFMGKYAEVVQAVGQAKDGSTEVRVLSTVIGAGRETVTTPEDLTAIRFNLRDNWDYEAPYFIPLIPRTPLERDQGYNYKTPGTEKIVDTTTPKTPDAPGTPEVPPTETTVETTTPDKKELKLISPEQYAALKEDLVVINKKIQGSEGIIALNKDDLKSELARKRYDDLDHIGDGKPVTFNKEELQTIGDELERALSNSKVDASLAETNKGVSKEMYEELDKDGAKIKEWMNNNREIQTINEDEVSSAYTKSLIKAFKEENTGRPSQEALSIINGEIEKMSAENPDAVAPTPESDVIENVSQSEDNADIDMKISAIAQKVHNDEALTPEETEFIAPYGPELSEKILELNNEERTIKKTFEKFTTDDDLIVEEYFAYKDLYDNDPKSFDIVYEDTHEENGSLKGKLKRAVDQIRKIINEGKSVALEDTVTRLLAYTKKSIETLGGTPIPQINSRSWAYWDIAKAQYNTEQPQGVYKSDKLKDPLAWKEKDNDGARRTVQYIADLRLGEEVIDRNPELQRTVLKTLDRSTPVARRTAERIEGMIKKPGILADHQLAKLGELIRKNKKLEPIVLLNEPVSKAPAQPEPVVVPQAAAAVEPVITPEAVAAPIVEPVPVSTPEPIVKPEPVPEIIAPVIPEVIPEVAAPAPVVEATPEPVIETTVVAAEPAPVVEVAPTPAKPEVDLTKKSDNLIREIQRITNRVTAKEYQIPQGNLTAKLNEEGDIVTLGSRNNDQNEWRDNDFKASEGEAKEIKKAYLDDVKMLNVLQSPLADKLTELANRLGGEKEIERLLDRYSNEEVGNTGKLLFNGGIAQWLTASMDQLPSIETIVDKELAQLRQLQQK